MAKTLFDLITEKLVTPILIFLIFLALFVGLWPFSFSADNNVRWLENRNGIAISPAVKGWRPSYYGIIYTPDKINLLSNTKSKTPQLTIELWLKAKSTFTQDVGAILTLDDGRDPAAVLFAQWRNSLIIRIRNDAAEDGYDEIGLRDALAKNQQSFITLTSSPGRVKLYLNGEWQRSYPNLTLIDTTTAAIQLVAGTTLAGTSDWCGDLYGLAIYGDTLSARQVSEHVAYWQTGTFINLIEHNDPLLLYPFDEREGDTIHNILTDQGHWRIPENFQILRKTFLGSVNGEIKVFRSLFKDVIINIAGFVLLGFFMALYLSKSIKSKLFVILYVFIICSLLSLGIEYLQVWLAQRDSSLLDFVLNSGGGFIGALGILVVDKLGQRFLTAKAQRERKARKVFF
jgi:hypothetical protein